MKRLRIDRIDVDLRGIDPAAARGAADRLGPAISRALSKPGATASPTNAEAPGANSLANRVARQIAGKARLARPGSV